MLERASTCIEPAAIHLLRRYDAPVRTTRILDRTFWRIDQDHAGSAAWWPAYLESVRARSGVWPRDFRATALQEDEHWRNKTRASRCKSASQTYTPPASGVVPQRSFVTTSTLRQQAAAVQAEDTRSEESSLPDGSDESGQHEEAWHATSEGARTIHDRLDDTIVEGVAEDASITPRRRLQLILDSQDVQRGQEAWRLFVSLPNSVTTTRALIHLLSSSSSRLDLERALTAFQSLLVRQKDGPTYAAAVEAAIKLRNLPKANALNREAVYHGSGFDSTKFLLAYHIRHGFWKSAADAWTTLQEIHPQKNAPTGPKTPNYEPDDNLSPVADPKSYWSGVDMIVHLPEQVLSVVERLKKRDPVLLFDEIRIKALAGQLLDRIVYSTVIMGAITANGLLSILGVCRDIGLLKAQHYFNAINTLRKSSAARNRAQLAIVIYRNMHFMFPNQKIPVAVLGCMVVICSDANLPTSSYDTLLEDFRQHHGMPDRSAYQKVMAACADRGDVTAVNRFFRDLCQDHGPPTDLAYLTPLLNVHASTGDVVRTRRQLDRFARVFGVEPNIYCWNILLKAYCRRGNVEGAVGLYETILKRGLKPDVYTFGTMTGLYANHGDTHGVYEVLRLARKHNILSTSHFTDALVHSYCLNDQLEEAEALAEQTTQQNQPESMTRMWNILLRHYAFQADAESLLRIQQKMGTLGVPPDSMTYAALMASLVIQRRTKDAVKVLRALHLNQTIGTTLFHYSIVLHGFAMEGDRDMAVVIYNEIVERFPRPSASARLAMLHLQSKRDISSYQQARADSPIGSVRSLRQSHAIVLLAETLGQMSSEDFASKEPQPGFGRRQPNRALPSIYMEFLISSYVAHDSFGQASDLLAQQQSLAKASDEANQDATPNSIQLLTTYVMACHRLSQWHLIDQAWSTIRLEALSIAQPVSLQLLGSQERHERERDQHTDTPSSASIEIFGENPDESGFNFRSMIPALTDKNSDVNDSRVMHAKRYLISTPLNRYMQALSTQHRFDDMIGLVDDIQRLGFAMTSQNWNVFIQALSRSPESFHQIKAFVFFEEELMANAPAWPVLLRSKWLGTRPVQSNQPNARKPRSRKQYGSTHPGENIPTYFTTVYLAAVLMNATRLSHQGRDYLMSHIRYQAPETVKYLERMPSIKDRIQAVLLRDKRSGIKGDPLRRPRAPAVPERSGILGSKSSVALLSGDELSSIPQSFDSDPQSVENMADSSNVADRALADHSHQSPDSAIRHAEHLTGPVLRSPAMLPGKGRYEDEAETSRRITREEERRLAMLTRLSQDSGREQIVQDDYHGDPSLPGLQLHSKDTNHYLTMPEEAQSPKSSVRLFSRYLEDKVAKRAQETDRAMDIAVEAIQKSRPSVPPADRLPIQPFQRRASIPKLVLPRFAKPVAKHTPRPMDSRRSRYYRNPIPMDISELNRFHPPKQLTNTGMKSFAKRKLRYAESQRRRNEERRARGRRYRETRARSEVEQNQPWQSTEET